jgi:nucleoside-diphosphate-sugar epimerase
VKTTPSHTVFITGATGYMGKRLCKQLLQRGHTVIALVRKGSEHKCPPGVQMVVADPFDAESFIDKIPNESVFIQLLGVPHPSPHKAKQFEAIDLRSVMASAAAAKAARVSHFIYVSVAMTGSGLMAAYESVRKKGEEICLQYQLNCTFIRPWYVIGPGHYWPVLLLPLYGIAELIPAWRRKARSMALVTIRQMITSLVAAAESDPSPLQIIDLRAIRNAKARQ